MKIATWNVNSIRVRLPLLLEWLREQRPDIVLLQEIKVQTDAFPATTIEDLGYNLAIWGQKTYNGVAILSKYPLEDVHCGFGDLEEARYIEAVAGGKIRVASVYVPNGSELHSPKYSFKLSFLEHLRKHLAQRLSYGEDFVVGGDYNIVPDGMDIYDPFEEGLFCSPEERSAFRSLLALGFSDAFRLMNPQKQAFTWWDYRAGSFQKNKGMRIDHLLLSPQATDRLTSVGIDTYIRPLEKTSDHVPVWCTLA